MFEVSGLVGLNLCYTILYQIKTFQNKVRSIYYICFNNYSTMIIANKLLTIIFCLIVVIFPYLNREKSKESLSNASTTLGILGTFIGILIGLIGFDTSNISTSVPELLGGLKTAFITIILPSCWTKSLVVLS